MEMSVIERECRLTYVSMRQRLFFQSVNHIAFGDIAINAKIAVTSQFEDI
jgi:hypothetical protein